MEFKRLRKALECEKTLSEESRAFILQMAESDVTRERLNSKLKGISIIDMFNDVFAKRSRVISKKVLNKYKEILKHYTEDELRHAMEMAKADDFHKESGYKYCTIEYFSRIEQIDKWSNIKQPEKKSNFTAPKFYTKESKNV
jgi:activator of HSP90 ATPase